MTLSEAFPLLTIIARKHRLKLNRAKDFLIAYKLLKLKLQ